MQIPSQVHCVCWRELVMSATKQRNYDKSGDVDHIEQEKMDSKKRMDKIRDADVDNANGEGDLADIVPTDN